MPLIYTFCSWFSVRTGSIVIAIISLIQSATFLFISLLGVQRAELISLRLDFMIEENDMLFTGPYFMYLEMHTEQVFVILVVANIIYIGSCFLLIHGSIKLNVIEVLPYILLEFLRLIALTILYTVVMLLIKKNILDFNILIVCLVSGSFILLLLCYFWLCPVSLVQCIVRVNMRKKATGYPEYKRFEKSHLPFYYDYLTDFKFKPVMPNRDYYQYQYGNLTRLQL